MLALSVFRCWRLVAQDNFPPVQRLRDRLTGARWVGGLPGGEQSGAGRWEYDRPLLADFLSCPYCLGAWSSFAAYVIWLEAPTEALYIAAPLALSAAVGIIAHALDS